MHVQPRRSKKHPRRLCGRRHTENHSTHPLHKAAASLRSTSANQTQTASCLHVAGNAADSACSQRRTCLFLHFRIAPETVCLPVYYYPCKVYYYPCRSLTLSWVAFRPGVACSVSGVGEVIMRACLAKECCQRMLHQNLSVDEACSQVMQETTMQVPCFFDPSSKHLCPVQASISCPAVSFVSL